MILRLDTSEAAILVGALLTAKHTLEETLVQVPPDFKSSAIDGIKNVELLLDKVEGILQDEVGSL